MVILDRILEHKRAEVCRLKETAGLKTMIRAVDRLPPARSLSGSLSRPGRVALLAEIKGASPSRGVIRENFLPAWVAGVYSSNGADAVSVLTDGKFFGGRPEYLAVVREATDLPILRKDFIIDPVQVLEARLLGADAVLLICAALGQGLPGLMRAAADAGMEALVEIHDQSELEAALAAGAGLIGINNRDLKTFVTDPGVTFRLRPLITDPSVVVVSESGIKSAADMKALSTAGVSAALVGEALMAAEDLASKVRELSYYWM
ncbi:MAG: indole-3-glycerol phosphate synthase TrpC [Bacillota bacterium]